MNYSPLRYPGGKGKIFEKIKEVFSENNLYDCRYIEPYAGGASLALLLLLNEYVSSIIINDKDRAVYSFWHSVINENEKLSKLIADTPINVEEWYKQKAIYSNADDYDSIELGFATFYLNRTNRSGILKAGIIGGKNQDGKWKIDARYNKKELLSRINKIALYKDRIEVTNEDASDLLSNVKEVKGGKTLLFLDPPYFVKGKDLYLNYYKESDHQIIASIIEKIESIDWLITYDNMEYIRGLYKAFQQTFFDINYSAGYAGRGSEVMIFSDKLKIPKSWR